MPEVQAGGPGICRRLVCCDKSFVVTIFMFRKEDGQDFGHSHFSQQAPEEDEEAGGDKDPMEGDRVAVPDCLLLELGLVETNAKGRVPESDWIFKPQHHIANMFI